MSAARLIHFISGLPRSGSTLLAALLRQKPPLHAGMSSPLASLVLAMQRAMSQENEGAPFIDEARREAVLRGVVAGYYEGLPAGVTAVDTNRTWCAKLPLLARLYPETWVVACVRGVGAIMDSFERVARANPQDPRASTSSIPARRSTAASGRQELATARWASRSTCSEGFISPEAR